MVWLVLCTAPTTMALVSVRFGLCFWFSSPDGFCFHFHHFQFLCFIVYNKSHTMIFFLLNANYIFKFLTYGLFLISTFSFQKRIRTRCRCRLCHSIFFIENKEISDGIHSKYLLVFR